jgi:hypothetical protein
MIPSDSFTSFIRRFLTPEPRRTIGFRGPSRGITRLGRDSPRAKGDCGTGAYRHRPEPSLQELLVLAVLLELLSYILLETLMEELPLFPGEVVSAEVFFEGVPALLGGPMEMLLVLERFLQDWIPSARLISASGSCHRAGVALPGR